MRRLVFLGFIVSLGFSSVALCQPSGKKCKELFSSAIEPYNNSDFAAALPLFEKGFEECKDSEFLAYVGFTLYSLHKYQEAEKAFTSYLEQFKKGKSRATVQSLNNNIPGILQTKISIQSTPVGATVWLDSKVDAPLGVAPLEVNVPPGKRTLIAEVEGYSRTELIVDIKQGGTTSAQIKLSEAPSKVSISTEPQGAQVLVDGAAVGMTPFEGKVPPGKHEVRVQKEGYGALIYKIEAELGKPFSYQAKLPPPFALLSFALPTDAVGVELLLDGKPLAAGATSAQVEGGEHKVTAKAKGYRVFNYTVAATAGQTHEVNVDLKKQGLYLDIQPNTKEAKIAANAQPANPGQIFVPVGQSVSIEVTQEGKLPYRETISATKDQDLRLAVEMSPPKLKKTWRALGTGLGVGLVGLGAAGFAAMKLERYENESDEFPATIQDYNTIRISAAAADACLVGTLVASYFTFRLYKKEKSGEIGNSEGTLTPQ